MAGGNLQPIQDAQSVIGHAAELGIPDIELGFCIRRHQRPASLS